MLQAIVSSALRLRVLVVAAAAAAFKESGAKGAILCGSDALYGTLALPVAGSSATPAPGANMRL